MTLDRHPDLDELIKCCVGNSDADTEMEAVHSHLRECLECRAETERLHTEIALATMTVPRVGPPSEAKQRLFQAAGVEIAPDTIAQPSSGKRILKLGSEQAVTTPDRVPVKPHRATPALVWGGWIAAAACLFYAVHIDDTNRALNQQLRAATAQIVQSADSAARAEKVLDVLSSPQAQRVTLIAAHSTPVPTGHAVYLARQSALVFTASNLAPLPANKTYELWIIPANGSAPVPAGIFLPDARGMASVLLPKLPQGIQAKAFGVTMENAGGSNTPTLPILLAGG